MKCERGSGTVLIGAVLLLLVLATLVALYLVAHLNTAARARTGADLCAIAGVQAHLSGQDACQVASETAVANSIRLRDCGVETNGFDIMVSVTVVAIPYVELPGVPDEYEQSAKAGNF